MTHRTEEILVDLDDLNFLAFCYSEYELVAVGISKALFKVVYT